jgi:hypothetical protein
VNTALREVRCGAAQYHLKIIEEVVAGPSVFRTVTTPWENEEVKRFLVTGKYDRHVRKFWIMATSQAEAEADALVLIKFYATGTKNYTTETWRFGAVTVQEVGDPAGKTVICGDRPHLRVVR